MPTTKAIHGVITEIRLRDDSIEFEITVDRDLERSGRPFEEKADVNGTPVFVRFTGKAWEMYATGIAHWAGSRCRVEYEALRDTPGFHPTRMFLEIGDRDVRIL